MRHDADRTAVREAARAHDLDRYLAALLAPKPVRDDLLTLAAFAGELARVPATASEPMIGEIRLQWWWDALETAAGGAATGHPVADAVAGLVRRGVADKAALQAVVDAVRESLFADPAPTDKALCSRIDARDGALARLAAGVVAASRGASVTQEARGALYAAAQGYGLARLVSGLPVELARGRSPIAGLPPGAKRSGPPPESVLRLVTQARDNLATARAVIAGLSALDRAIVQPAVLPAALIEPYLRAFEAAARHGSGWADRPIDMAPLRRVWVLLKARRTGRL